MERCYELVVIIFIWFSFPALGQEHMVNVALQKVCSMSSRYTSKRGFKNNCTAAINGNTNTSYDPGNCIHTKTNDSNSAWAVDLGNAYFIKKITVYGRTAHPDRIGNVKVVLGQCEGCPNGSSFTVFNFPAKHQKIITDIVVNHRLVACACRHVTLSRPQDFLNFCEVQVWECENGRYGQKCQETCGQCADGKDCDKTNGSCPSCPPGFQPPLCKDENEINEGIFTEEIVTTATIAVAACEFVVIVVLVVIVAKRKCRRNGHGLPTPTDEQGTELVDMGRATTRNRKNPQPSTQGMPDVQKSAVVSDNQPAGEETMPKIVLQLAEKPHDYEPVGEYRQLAPSVHQATPGTHKPPAESPLKNSEQVGLSHAEPSQGKRSVDHEKEGAESRISDGTPTEMAPVQFLTDSVSDLLSAAFSRDRQQWEPIYQNTLEENPCVISVPENYEKLHFGGNPGSGSDEQ